MNKKEARLRSIEANLNNQLRSLVDMEDALNKVREDYPDDQLAQLNFDRAQAVIDERRRSLRKKKEKCASL